MPNNKNAEYYAKTNSPKAEKLIINLFNKLNNDESFEMKTVTTIYKESDIFKGNSRYPIDAPFRDFYVDLTEDYVNKHKLDDIFFDNDQVSTGEFYFEFFYHEKINLFTVSEYPKNLGIKNTKNYVPMLFSMITGLKINWEEARQNLVFDKTHLSDKIKVLLVFGEDQLKRLSFGWLTTFVIKGDCNLNEIIKKIREQEHELVNYIQGVLFSELEEVIIHYVENQAKLDQSRELIKDYGHTMKNLGFKNAFIALYEKLKTHEDLIPFFNRLENKYLVQLFAANILITKQTNKGEKLAIEKENYNSFTALIDLFHKASKDNQKEIVFYDSIVKEHPLNKISSIYLPYVFTLLYNLYSNALSHNKGHYSINFIVNSEDNLIIYFFNKGEFPKDLICYLKKEKIQDKDKSEGLSYIHTALEALKDKIYLTINNPESNTLTTLNGKTDLAINDSKVNTLITLKIIY